MRIQARANVGRPSPLTLAGRRRLLEQGAIASDHAELDIFRRMAALEAEAPGCSLLIQNAFMRDRKLGDASVWSLPELRNLRSDPRILDLCEQLVGSEVAAHPNAVLRCRAPTPASGADGGRVPWHQGTVHAPSLQIRLN